MHNPCLLANKALLHAPTPAHTAHNARHLAHNCEGGRLGYAPKSLSGQNPCLRSPSQEGRALGGRISKQLGWKGKGLASQFAPSPHLRGSKEGTIGSHLPSSTVPRRASSSIKRACLPRTTGATCLLSLETWTYYRSVNAETHLAHLLCIQRAFLQLYLNLQLCCFSLSSFDALFVKYFKEFPL